MSCCEERQKYLNRIGGGVSDDIGDEGIVSFSPRHIGYEYNWRFHFNLKLNFCPNCGTKLS